MEAEMRRQGTEGTLVLRRIRRGEAWEEEDGIYQKDQAYVIIRSVFFFFR